MKNYIREIIAGKHNNLDIYKFIALLPSNLYRGLFWNIWNYYDRKGSCQWYTSKKRNTYLVFGSLACTANGIDDNIWKQQCADLDKIIAFQP